MKEKAIEICNNITQTLSKMGSHNLITGMNPMFQSTRASRKMLENKRTQIKRKYNI